MIDEGQPDIDEGEVDLDEMECYVSDTTVQMLEPLTYTRVARIKDMEKFKKVTSEVSSLQSSQRSIEQGFRESEGIWEDNGQSWIIEALNQLIEADSSEKILAEGVLTSPSPGILLYIAGAFTRKFIADQEQDKELQPRMLDLLADGKIEELRTSEEMLDMNAYMMVRLRNMLTKDQINLDIKVGAMGLHYGNLPESMTIREFLDMADDKLARARKNKN